MRRLPLILAFAAVLFGGVLLGVGNMLLLAPDAHAHGPVGGHAGHGPVPADDSVLPIFVSLPAHCLFCLDGVVPQPVQLALAEPATAAPADQPEPTRSTRVCERPYHTGYSSRAPPSTIV